MAVASGAQPGEVREGEGEPTLEGCFAADGTDLTLIAAALDMTPTERLAALQSMADLVALVRRPDED
jgi:hypothetical protein